MDQAPARRLQDGLLTMPGPTPDEIYACSELHVAGAAYLKKYGLMKHFGVNAGLMDEFLVNHPRNCVGADREPRGRAISKLELIKLWYGRTLMPMRHMYSWPVPTPGALALIKGTVESRKLKGVVEMGAGTGYWASLLKAGGIDVIAFDKDINGMKPDKWAFVCKPVPFHDVYLGGPEMLKRGAYCTRALFLCYPPSGDIMCDQALCNFEGDYVIYVGALDRLHCLSSTLPECSRAEHPIGVGTGHPLFFMRLAKDWDVVQHVPLPSHFFCRDHLVVLERRVACRKAPRPEIHERLTPKWKGLSPEEASDHVRKIDQENKLEPVREGVSHLLRRARSCATAVAALTGRVAIRGRSGACGGDRRVSGRCTRGRCGARESTREGGSGRSEAVEGVLARADERVPPGHHGKVA
ncbi:unnamed protein product [Prorocentrum cordatum]|uniref:Uncharacterized protein n=1 Tax=Prorocentrum cordatum TaxID=2364126 RepID=A0ABN9SDV7_9DINO|nr:unnamed protein product [Polarella glacialis]